MNGPRIATAVFLAVACFGGTDAVRAQEMTARQVAANDNRRPAGTLANGVLRLSLLAGRGAWRPEKDEGPALDVAAFGEEGGQLLTPGPLVRVPEGTELVVSVRNMLTESLQIHGFVTRPSSTDTVFSVPTGETRELRFMAGAPGTYSYWASTGKSALASRNAFESQLGGAFVVDSRESASADRVFVMTQWTEVPPINDDILTPKTRLVYAINGYSWPHTERLDERVGQRARWRVVNLTRSNHPMHLHGFFFDVESVGTSLQDVIYESGQTRHVVTEYMRVGTTMQMAWTPEREGNWLWHCHIVSHVTPALRFWRAPQQNGHEHAGHGAHDAMTQMAGLVVGIRVTTDRTPETPIATVTPARTITLAMRTQTGYWKPEDAYAFALDTPGAEATRQQPTVPGPLLVLQRGQPVEITLKNELPESTAIHWHGIELESYFDGVPGWSGTSGSPASTTPAIESGGSFRVRFTPPRAGTFIYHTHAHDARQLASGLYGAIVVIEPGETFDPARDHIVLIGMEGPKNTLTYERFPVVVNGTRTTSLAFKAGVPNRVRVINITTNFPGLNVSMIASTNQPVSWRPIAKDGADLPASQQVARPALRQPISVGEVYDFVVEAPTALAWIEIRRSNGEWIQQVPIRAAP